MVGPAILLLLVLAAVLLRWPEIGTLIAVTLLYLNLPAIAVKLHALPYPIVLLAGCLIVPALLRNLFSQRDRIILDWPFLLMLVFLGLVLASSLLARDTDLAMAWIQKYLLEGLLLYLVIINLVRTFATLRRVVWALLLSGTLLASMTLYQELSHSYANEFGGLAQRTLERETRENVLLDEYNPRDRPKVRIAYRAQGPIDDPNRYGQMLVVLLPLGWFRIKGEQKALGKVLAVICSTVILGGVLLTYSRGAFLSLLVMLGLIIVMRRIKLYQVAIAALALILSIQLVAPGYVNRMLTLRGIPGLFSPTAEVEPDPVQRGRATEMLAAWQVFLDHPILGVGPGQFTPIYSIRYMSRHYSLRRITDPRRAHSLYLEMAAETGILGLASFMAIAITSIRRLVKAGRRSAETHPELANLSTALVLSIAAYLTTAVFLQLSFQRYYWLLLGLAGAACKVAQSIESPVRARLAATPAGQAVGRTAATPAPSR
jgi:hypothetical protein